MAASKKKSRAEQAVSESRKKSGNTEPEVKSSSKKNSKETTKAPKVTTEYDKKAPSTTAAACISMVLFALFLVICIKPDGAVLLFIQSVVLGLIGKAGFYFSVPALLFLFIINVFGRKDDVRIRSFCIMLFVFCCGCIYHLVVSPGLAPFGWVLIQDLFTNGIKGTSGGVICGGVAMLLRWGCGDLFSYIAFGGIGVIALLASLRITIPSIIRAIANRPRENWEDEEDDEQETVYIEPAARIVNTVVTSSNTRRKLKEQKEKEKELTRLREQELQRLQAEQLPPAPPAKKPQKTKLKPDAPVLPAAPVSIPAAAPAVSTPQQEESKNLPPDKRNRMMGTIDLDIDAPLSGTRGFVTAPKSTVSAAAPVFVDYEDQTGDTYPVEMPPLQREAAVAKHVVKEPAPKVQKSSGGNTGKGEKQSKVTARDTEESAQQVAAEIAKGQTTQSSAYCFPPIDLLKRPSGAAADGTDEMRENSRRLNETLASFHIDAHITNVTRGPSVTRYEVELDKGVRLNKLTNCADDIALSLGASGVRIAAVPGKISIVGIEVPNRAVTTVSLREVIDSPEFNKSKSKSSFAVGKDIGGSCIVGNISKMPHMLIAGTTGSGKSVCMNSIIISLLYKSGPEDVKLIMVDPKMVELGIYNSIPHLLIPVVTDPKKAAGSLQWAVTEMLRRYKMMSEIGVRDLESYNTIVTAEEGGQKLPQVIIIIDELADLMLVAAKEVEDSICRIAQMGRAAGMHLIIATQRPSADVITGLMKANIPSRIAFSVASAMESRIILDTQGAEKLVGKGDMLYAPIGIGKPMRVQGCFVTDSEVEAVAGYVKENYNADYNQEVLEEIEKKALQTGTKGGKAAVDPEPSGEELEGDEMLPAAVEVILETGQASVSMLQRRLKLGYSRAARIVDEMEEKGIVGPFQGAKPRSILITKEQWAAMQGGSGQMDFDDLDASGVPEELD